MKKHKGFTLTEVLIVLVIVIATCTWVMIQGKDFLGYGRYSSAKSGANSLALAVAEYRFEMGAYPASLNSMTSKVSGKGPWTDTDSLTDPWGVKYVYEADSSNNKFGVWSCGENKTSESSVSSGIAGDDVGSIGH